MVTVHQPKRNNITDFIIVGQGIAGSVLALSLIQKGYTVCVINKPELSKSSVVAAGIWNPVVFKRLTKSWMADELVPELITFYTYWQSIWQSSMLHRKQIIKPFTEEQEKNLWLKKSVTENKFLSKNTFQNFELTHNYSVNLFGKVLNAGNLDTAAFIANTKSYIETTQNYLEENFDYPQLKVFDDSVNYKNINATHVVFCEGHLISNNPYFKNIPLKPAKGEVITIKSMDINLTTDIFNKGFFVLPLGNNLYKVGATYEWTDLNDNVTEKGKQELEEKLKTIINTPYEIVSHHAGVRPSVIDRRPVIGHHTTHKNILVFNGMGTKAVMLAPYFAKHFVNHLADNSPIDAEVNVNRF